MVRDAVFEQIRQNMVFLKDGLGNFTTNRGIPDNNFDCRSNSSIFANYSNQEIEKCIEGMENEGLIHIADGLRGHKEIRLTEKGFKEILEKDLNAS